MSHFDFTGALTKAARESQDFLGFLTAKTSLQAELLPQAVVQAGFRYLSSGEVFAPGEREIVIGVAPWSDPDLKVLEDLAARLNRAAFDVIVFDVDRLSPIEIERFLEGRPPFYRTPAVFQYLNGKQAYFGQGDEAVKWLRRFASQPRQ